MSNVIKFGYIVYVRLIYSYLIKWIIFILIWVVVKIFNVSNNEYDSDFLMEMYWYLDDYVDIFLDGWLEVFFDSIFFNG